MKIREQVAADGGPLADPFAYIVLGSISRGLGDRDAAQAAVAKGREAAALNPD